MSAAEFRAESQAQLLLSVSDWLAGMEEQTVAPFLLEVRFDIADEDAKPFIAVAFLDGKAAV